MLLVSLNRKKMWILGSTFTVKSGNLSYTLALFLQSEFIFNNILSVKIFIKNVVWKNLRKLLTNYFDRSVVSSDVI